MLQIVDFGIKKGERLGLDICSYQNRVIVSNTVQESVSAKQLKRGDHIIDVNGTRVSEMSVASNFISQSLNVSREPPKPPSWRPSHHRHSLHTLL